jgi:dynein light chain Tctex-type 1
LARHGLKILTLNLDDTVNCTILQKRNAGYHTNSTCFWDAERDGSVAVRWENGTMTCVLTVYCISLQ